MKRGALVVCCVLAFSIGDYFAAKWGQSRASLPLVLALLIGPCAYLLFGHLSATISLTRMGGYVNGGVVLCTALGGMLLLGERADLKTWLALGLIVSGLILLSLGRVDRGLG